MGRMSWHDGSVYEGEFEYGAMHCDQAVFTYGSGSKYTGSFQVLFLTQVMRSSPLMGPDTPARSFQANQKDGVGVFEHANGDVFRGTFKQNKMEGEGCVYRFGSHDSQLGGWYEGGFREDLVHGLGRYVYGNGESFRGSFLHGKKEGPGEHTYADGSIYRGHYVDDNMAGEDW